MEMTDTKWYLSEWQKKQKNKNRKEKVRRGPFKNKNVYLSIFLRIFTIYYFLLFLFFVSLGWLSAISSIIFSITCFLTYTSKLSIQMKENFRRKSCSSSVACSKELQASFYFLVTSLASGSICLSSKFIISL